MPSATDLDAGAGPAGRLRVLVAGATGYIGRQVVRELVSRGHDVVSLVRLGGDAKTSPAIDSAQGILSGSEVRVAEVTDADDLGRNGIRGEAFDAFVSCLATRNGGIRDSWAVEYRANQNLLEAARLAGADKFVLLSAICVQRPRLEFQKAKLAFESELRQSELTWSIVRPTAFFKSLAGQIPRIRAGKPFLMFGSGAGPACKPISEADTASYMADCLVSPELQNRILPIGGPGPALAVRERGELLFELSGMRPRFRSLPVGMFTVAAAVLGAGGRILPGLRDKAEFARIGRYYATESMLVLNPETGEYDAAATPEYGSRTLADFYRDALAHGLKGQERGDHALF